jgi:hypothetical protein
MLVLFIGAQPSANILYCQALARSGKYTGFVQYRRRVRVRQPFKNSPFERIV